MGSKDQADDMLLRIKRESIKQRSLSDTDRRLSRAATMKEDTKQLENGDQMYDLILTNDAQQVEKAYKLLH